MAIAAESHRGYDPGMIPIRDALPSRRFPVVTVSLIVLNIAAYAFQAFLGSKAAVDFVYRFALIPDALTSGSGFGAGWVTLITSLFLHGGLVHLLSNMLYLWIFGDNVEDAMGPVRFAVFYLLCGVVASLSHIAIAPHSTVPLVGASGAIAGVLAAYFMLFPYARVLTLIPIIFFIRLVSLPAVYLLGFWFLLQIINAGAYGMQSGVAWFAHIGGFLVGLVLVFPLRRPGVPVVLWHRIRRRFR